METMLVLWSRGPEIQFRPITIECHGPWESHSTLNEKISFSDYQSRFSDMEERGTPKCYISKHKS
jgi:hypothetical protein